MVNGRWYDVPINNKTWLSTKKLPFFQMATFAMERIGNQRYNFNRSEWASATFSRFYAICHSALLRGEKYTRGEIQIYLLLVFCIRKGTNTRSFFWQLLFNCTPCLRIVTFCEYGFPCHAWTTMGDVWRLQFLGQCDNVVAVLPNWCNVCADLCHLTSWVCCHHFIYWYRALYVV